MNRSILIIEEQLAGVASHHFGQISDLLQSAREMGAEVSILCNVRASEAVKASLQAVPILVSASSFSISSTRFRFVRLLLLAIATFINSWRIFNYIRKSRRYHMVFIPTTWVHHVISLFPAVIFCGRNLATIRLQFLCCWDVQSWRSRWSLSLLRMSLVVLGKIHPDLRVFGQTPLVCSDIKGKTDLDITWLPDVAHSVDGHEGRVVEGPTTPVIFGSYGFARHEQGVDILQEAVKEVLRRQPNLNAHFRIMWQCGEILLPNGKSVGPDAALEGSGKVTFYKDILLEPELLSLLAETDWVILPYRCSSYERRSSRVAVDAICRGIPSIYTRGTFLEFLFREFGCGVSVPDGDAHSLAEAIELAVDRCAFHRSVAVSKAGAAQVVFSARTFWLSIC